MKAGPILLGIVGVIVVVALLGGGCALQGYNQVVGMDENVKSQWAQVENQLKRRYDLIPNLIETVKGIAGQEEKIFLGIAEARKAYFSAQTVNEKAEAANRTESALSRLLLLQEKYPELRSSQSFRDLSVSLEGTENRLAVARKDYNDAVQTLNTYIRRFPGQLFAALAGVAAATYFEVEEAAKTTPKVDFSEKQEPKAEAEK